MKYAYVIILSLIGGHLFGQVKKGTKSLQFGFGLHPVHKSATMGAFEYSFSNVISAGPVIELVTGTYNGPEYSGSYLGIFPGARFSAHLLKNSKKVDLYIGGHAGLKEILGDFYEDYVPEDYQSGYFVGAHFGARFYFTKSFGLFLETAAGSQISSTIKGGVALRFGGSL